MHNDELQHGPFKYVKREWKNGRWQYFYDTDAKKRDKAYKSNKGTLEAYQKHGNKYSRNMPGSSATEANTGKGMTSLQRAQAMAKGTGNYTQWNKITRQHASELNARNKLRDTGFSKDVSRNIPGNESADGGAFKKSKPSANPKKTTKKQIRKGIRRAKVKALKREAKEAIARAQTWLEGLFE